MKIKDLVEMLLKLNQEAEIGVPVNDMIPTKTFKFFDNDGWKEYGNNVDFDEIKARCQTIYEKVSSGEFSLEECLQTCEVTIEQYNEYIKNLWSKFNVITREHFYHVGGKEKNRNPVIEALVTNYFAVSTESQKKIPLQYMLLESQASYGTDNSINATMSNDEFYKREPA